MKQKNKGYQHCVRFEFLPHKWYMVSVVHVYNRWSKSEIRCYVDGQLCSQADMSWLVSTNDMFDRCIIGSTPEQEMDSMFCGQISSIYGFSESLSPQQISAIHSLGPAYKGQFRFENESSAALTDSQCRVLYDGKLSSSVMFSYNPVACDSQLCLDQTPKTNTSIFPHSPHALMMGDVKSVQTQSIQSTLHSLGGVQIFYPLFSQLDCTYTSTSRKDKEPISNIASLLTTLVCDLVKSSPAIQQQFLESRGFLVISQYLEKASPVHINFAVLDTLLNMTRMLLKYGSSSPVVTGLLKQMYDYILYNPDLWINASVEVQTTLYNFLATEFLTAPIFTNIRRVSAVLQSIHTLKHYYWIVDPQNRSGFQSKAPVNAVRLDLTDLATIRASLLVYVKQLVLRGSGIQDDELQAILNYLTTVHEDDNLRDVLYFALTLISQHPSSMVPAFDRKNGVRCIFKLMASEDEEIRIYALKFLGLYLMRSTHKRKHDSMGPHNLFSLISDRLLLYTTSISMATYNALFEILTEKLTLVISHKKHTDPDQSYRLENPMLLKVIAHMIRYSKQTPEVREVRTLFLKDLTLLCNSCKENRRTVLQMSVWQDWMFALAPIYPSNPQEETTTNMVMALFRLLLHHAIKYEYGGWRVWIDTLAILHSKVAYEDFRQRLNQVYQQYEKQRVDTVMDPEIRRQLPVSSVLAASDAESGVDNSNYVHSGTSAASGGLQIREETATPAGDTTESREIRSDIDGVSVARPGHPESGESGTSQVNSKNLIFSPGPRSAPFRIPEFSWSYLHQKLLDDLLCSIENDIQTWKRNGTKNVIEFVNSSENHVYVINLIHLVSQLSDTLVTSCGGLLPLLAAATSPNGEVDMLETSQGIKMEDSVGFLLRLMNLADIVVFASSQNFQELEQEKNMANGGILRQCLRLVCTCAVRNCLECRYRTLYPPRQARSSSSASGSSIASNRGPDIGPPDRVQELIAGLKSYKKPTNSQRSTDESTEANTIKDQLVLLQEMDITRLRAVVYRDAEETKQSQFLALAIVYFISVLMVSKYRDILEPPTPQNATPTSSRATNEPIEDEVSNHKEVKEVKTKRGSADSPVTVVSEEDNVNDSHSDIAESGENMSALSPETGPQDSEFRSEISPSDKQVEDDQTHSESASAVESAEATTNREDQEEDQVEGIASIQVPTTITLGDTAGNVTTTSDTTIKPAASRPSDLGKFMLPEVSHFDASVRDEASLTEKLEKALGTSAPLLREVFMDFSSYLSKTLLGSHGQELLAGGLVALKQTTSVVELVMLLCSQEWQNSLQKHAGLAFIELVNEGRLLSHATRDHIVRVANEAEFILNRMRAEDVQKHSDFEQLCAQTTNERRDEEKLCDHLITSARQRDWTIADRIQAKVFNIMNNQYGPWGSAANRDAVTYYRLDTWEDDSRRRRRLIPNPFGSSHPEATIVYSRDRVQDASDLKEEKENLSGLKVPLNKNSGVSDEGYGVTDEELTNQTTTKIANSSSANQKDVQQSTSAENTELVEMELDGPVALSTKCKMLAPGVVVNGILSITKTEMYFEMDQEDEENKSIDKAILKYVEYLHGKWSFNEIRAIFSRRYLHKNIALEMFISNRSAIMFAFPDQTTVKRVVSCLPRLGIGVKYNLPQTRKSSLAAPKQIFKHSIMTQRWQKREISNFDYLMYLNTVAGRTYNDLNQYPVFPWIVSNYESEELDLSSPSNYRDLSKPIGALNPSREEFFKERYQNWDDDSQPAFHYGTHYSTAAFVMNYLVRVEPFTTMFINFQGGKFDNPNRTFHSISQTWKNCQRDTSDVKELIPEMFFLPEMLQNNNGYNMGVTEDGKLASDVELPPWASSPEEFIRIHRQALESEFVSSQLHQWIDLIFGYKQRGPEAVRATNVFCHLTYEGSVDWAQLDTDPILRKALEDQIKSFGQTPCQLLSEPHPPRNSAMHVSPMMFSPLTDDLCMMMKFLSNSPVVMLSANTHPASPNPAVVTIAANHCYSINQWNNSAAATVQSSSNDSGTYLQSGPVSIQQPSGIANSSDSQPTLPLSMDKHLAQSLQSPRRSLGDNFDERLRPSSVQFATTPDSKILFGCGYWDKSFRVYSIDTGRIMQVVYGHFGVVTCLARSEGSVSQDCYIVTGSEDCTVMLWLWSVRQQAIVSEAGSADYPTPRATLTGHQDSVTCVMVSSELGLILSGSKDGICLLHTTQGELLCSLTLAADIKVANQFLFSREGYLVMLGDCRYVSVYSLNGKFLRSSLSPSSASKEGAGGSVSHQSHSNTHAILLTKCGQYVLTAGDTGVVHVLSTQNLQQLYAFPACDTGIKSLGLTHDQRFLLAGLSNGCVVVFNIDFNRWHHEFQERYSAAN